MTGYQRFEPANSTYRGHGAALVGAVLRATDGWLQIKKARSKPRSWRPRFNDSPTARALKTTCMLFVVCLPAASYAGWERCPEAPVDVSAGSPDERSLACSAANDAIELLGRCEISLRRPLQVEILSEVRHPFSGSILGLFDTKHERVLVTQYMNIPSLVRGTPYAELPQREFYKSLIVHEVIHGIMHQNLKWRAMSHAAYEYPAYALQIESLPSGVREKFLQSADKTASKDDFMFNDSILFFDPFFFAARAYGHFKAAANGCAHLHALLKGEVPFILTMPLR